MGNGAKATIFLGHAILAYLSKKCKSVAENFKF